MASPRKSGPTARGKRISEPVASASGIQLCTAQVVRELRSEFGCSRFGRSCGCGGLGELEINRALAAVERKTVRRYVAAAVGPEVGRDDGDGQLSDEVIGRIRDRLIRELGLRRPSQRARGFDDDFGIEL